MLVGELPDKIAALEKAIGGQDIAAVATLAQQLKGSAGGYGFPSITQAAKVLERKTSWSSTGACRRTAPCAEHRSLRSSPRANPPEPLRPARRPGA